MASQDRQKTFAEIKNSGTYTLHLDSLRPLCRGAREENILSYWCFLSSVNQKTDGWFYIPKKSIVARYAAIQTLYTCRKHFKEKGYLETKRYEGRTLYRINLEKVLADIRAAGVSKNEAPAFAFEDFVNDDEKAVSFGEF